MLKFITIIAVFYLLLTAVVFLKQRSLLYQPSQFGLTNTQAAELDLKKWPDESEYRGYLRDHPDSELTIVVFHGNAGEAANRLYYLTALARFNARIILAEYPGYGERSGSPSENTFVSDAQKTLDLVSKAYPNEPLLVIGESMGTGVASAAVTNSSGQIGFDNSAIKGLVLITPWDSLSNLAQHHYWYLPARWLVLDRYDSVRNLQSFNSPVAVVIAGQDRVIPAEHAETLFNSISTKKARFMLEAAGHNNWLNYVDDVWWQELMSFVSSSTTTSSSDQNR